MRTFADYLPTMTAREREIVEAYREHYGAWQNCRIPLDDHPLELMHQTPTAKEPVSVTGRWTIVRGIGQAFVWESPLAFKLGDRVRITKIEGER